MLNILPTRSDAALRRIVRHAATEVPYYRAMFETLDVDPAAMRSVADLAALPITTKADIQREPDAFLSRGTDPTRLLSRTTSGSTGQPATIRNAPFDEFRRQLARWRIDLGYGVRPGDRRMRFRTPRPLLTGDRILLNLLAAGRLYHQEKVDSRLSGAEALERLLAFRPSLIDGMTNTTARAASEALDRGETRIRPRYVTTGGETLTAETRRRIREAFDAPVFDVFGTCETGVIASECPASGLYHVAAGVAIEVLRPDGRAAADGEEGAVVATSLQSRVVPVIRYGTGDVAVRGPDVCPCGAAIGTLRAILGRETEIFHLPDGRALHPWHFPVRDQTWIRSFQLEQERPDRFVLRLVPGAGASQDDVDALHHAVLGLLGPAAGLSIEICEDLVVRPFGKHRPFVALPPSASGKR